jgi:hypothetical protein
VTKPNSHEGKTMTQEEYMDIPGLRRRGWAVEQTCAFQPSHLHRQEPEKSM